MKNASTGAETERKGLGTFAGVFTPSILTILGIILFLRMGFVVGQAGLVRALLIVGLANLISVLTSVSLAAIATNLKVKGGGDYFLISRTLGHEYGGALGVVLFLAQSISIAFYSIGFGEAVTAIGGLTAPLAAPLVATAAVAGLFVLAWLGADWATKFQFGIMAILFAAIGSFVIGALGGWDTGLLRQNWSPAGTLPIAAVFAVFFPAVTGFTQGVSMSGDLEDPGRSLPRGTFAAVALSVVVYLGVTVLFAASAEGTVLASDFGVMRRIAALPWLVDAGVIAATLSSALASFLGAPRILQSLASDRIFPWLQPFAAGHAETGNPRRAVLLSGAIALGTIALGNLNLVASIVAMFFLISYGLLNYATYFEARTKSPSFRPRFKWFHPGVSLAGALCCGVAIIAIDAISGVVAFAVIIAIFQYLKRTRSTERWSDSVRSWRFQRIREQLVAMAGDREHPRDWRPNILALSNDPTRRERLLRFAAWLEAGSGFTTAVKIVVERGVRGTTLRDRALAELEADVRERGLEAFCSAVLVPEPETGFEVMLQSAGLGPIRPNLLLLNWFDQERLSTEAPGLQEYGFYLRRALAMRCAVVIVEAATDELDDLAATPGEERRIDVWFRDDATGRLSLLLAYLVTRSTEWNEAKIRLLARTGEAEEETLAAMLEDVRIEAEIVTVSDAIAAMDASRSSAMVFVPFSMSGNEPTSPDPVTLDELASALPITLMVAAAEEIALDAQPDEGPHADVAAAADATHEADRKAAAMEKEARKAVSEAEKKTEKATAAAEANDESAEKLEKEANAARAAAEEATRRAAKARTKADAAKRDEEALADQPPERRSDPKDGGDGRQ